MDAEQLKKRTKTFTLDVMRFVKDFPSGRDAKILGDQLYRAGGSVGANYRAACRSKTKATFIHKLGIVEEEADECCFWLEVCLELKIGEHKTVKKLWDEADQLTSIFTAANRTLKFRGN